MDGSIVNVFHVDAEFTARGSNVAFLEEIDVMVLIE